MCETWGFIYFSFYFFFFFCRIENKDEETWREQQQQQQKTCPNLIRMCSQRANEDIIVSVCDCVWLCVNFGGPRLLYFHITFTLLSRALLYTFIFIFMYFILFCSFFFKELVASTLLSLVPRVLFLLSSSHCLQDAILIEISFTAQYKEEKLHRK